MRAHSSGNPPFDQVEFLTKIEYLQGFFYLPSYGTIRLCEVQALIEVEDGCR